MKYFNCSSTFFLLYVVRPSPPTTASSLNVVGAAPKSGIPASRAATFRVQDIFQPQNRWQQRRRRERELHVGKAPTQSRFYS